MIFKIYTLLIRAKENSNEGIFGGVQKNEKDEGRHFEKEVKKLIKRNIFLGSDAVNCGLIQGDKSGGPFIY